MAQKSLASRLTTSTMQQDQQKQFVSQNNLTIEGTTLESLAVITEEQSGLTASSMRITPSKVAANEIRKDLLKCICRKYDEVIKNQQAAAEDVERLLREKEAELRAEYDRILEKELALMKERFDFILANEQTRACYMLREAHRERQEKIIALQSQLECKNLAALMYVMCTERRRSKLEKLRIIRDYTNYIHALQDILTDGQELILHLSRGYKTAARVDHEWREKMKKVVGEFLSFIYNFAGGSPETNQYFIDLPALLTTSAPIVDDPNEDPCEPEENEELPTIEIPKEKEWWEQLDDDNRPFVMFGDLSEFTPNDRREIIKRVKAPKTAPKKWRQYVFNQMFHNATCANVGDIKDLYLNRLPTPSRWECQPMSGFEQKGTSRQSISSRPDRREFQSIDIRGNMGSLLKMMTSANTTQSTAKTALLGARDSMEITSTTKLPKRNSLRPSLEVETEIQHEEKPDVIAVGRRRTSLFEQMREEDDVAEETTTLAPPAADTEEEDIALGSVHNDSLQVIPSHIPDNDHRLYYERVCPMEKCQLMQVDSFMRGLPSYMRANPFTHFEHTYDGYETCTPEQLEMLKQRIESRKAKEPTEADREAESPAAEWEGRGVAVQTSELSMSLPPCTCHGPSPSPVSSNFVFNFQDLMPVKVAMDAIHKECLYDARIEFDRFQVIGQDNKDIEKEEENPKREFKDIRYGEIKKILRQHPSLLDIFQANTRR